MILLRRKAAVSLVIAVALALSACGASPQSSSSKPSSQTIAIGLSAPLSGAEGSIGQEYQNGIDLAISQINASGGVLGRNLQLFSADNACDNATGVNAVGSLAEQDHVVAIIGSACSNVTLAVMPVIQRLGVTQLTVGATSPAITQGAGVGGNQWEFRLNINDAIMGQADSELVALDGLKSVVVIASNDAYGQGAAAVFAQSLPSLGVRTLSTEYYARGQNDFRPMLTKIKGENPQGLIVIADYPDAAPMALQAQEIGLTNVKIYDRGTIVSQEFEKLVKNPAIWSGAAGAARWAPSGSQFETQFKARYGRAPDVLDALPYYGVQVLAKAIEAAHSTNRTAIRNALAKMNICIPDLGPIHFDSHHQAHPDVFVVELDHGTIKLLKRMPSASHSGSSCQ